MQVYSSPGSSLYSSSTTVVEGGDVVLVKVVEREREREGHIVVLGGSCHAVVVHITFNDFVHRDHQGNWCVCACGCIPVHIRAVNLTVLILQFTLNSNYYTLLHILCIVQEGYISH